LGGSNIALQAQFLNGLHFDPTFPCLAIVDYEVLNTQVMITELNLLATINVVWLKVFLSYC